MLAVKKKVRHFGFKATFFASLYSESLLFRQLGLDSQTVQSVCIFAGNWLALSYDSILETSITFGVGTVNPLFNKIHQFKVYTIKGRYGLDLPP